MSAHTPSTLVFIPGNHLYPISLLAGLQNARVVMVEDKELCSRRLYHQQKLGLIIAAMREYAQSLTKNGIALDYHPLASGQNLSHAITKAVEAHNISTIATFEITDRTLERRLTNLCSSLQISWRNLGDPGFLSSKSEFSGFRGEKQTLRMGHFYQRQRRTLNILMEPDGKPIQGKWSFDSHNRKKFPKRQTPPAEPTTTHSKVTEEALSEVANRFGRHPGDARGLWLPTTREKSLEWMHNFIDERLIGFGTYEDAICIRSETLFHSTLAPLINLGLVTPAEVVEATLTYAAHKKVPINDLEGFLRQIIGWREFVRGVYCEFTDRLKNENVRNQNRRLTQHWSEGTTGLPPLDHAIRQQRRLGWNHHINRLMVIANLMNLCEILPSEVYEYFFCNYVDAYEWVMVPNVYGMGLNSDDGVFATKPYICGSNYILKMSDFDKGDWCDVWDGLYWRFVETHQSQLFSNPRLAPMLGHLTRMPADRRSKIFSAAEQFLQRCTRP